MSDFDFNCPNCQQSLEASEDIIGEELECPACGQTIQVPAPAKLRASRKPSQSQSAPQNVNVEVNRGASPLGIAALVMGIIGCLFAWIPFLGLLSIPIAGIGIILAFIGFIMALANKKTGFGFPISGGLVCALSLFIAFAITGGTAKSISDSMKEAEKTKQKEVPKGATSKSSETATEMAQPETYTSAPKEEAGMEKWTKASSAVRQANIQVEIVSVEVGQVPVKTMFGDTRRSEDELLQIKLKIANISRNKKIDFDTWRGADFSFGRDFAALTDDNDNVYKRVSLGTSSRPIGGVTNESIYPGKSITDVLIFEQPIKAIKWLHLELPAKNFEGEGMIRFEIPRNMIKW